MKLVYAFLLFILTTALYAQTATLPDVIPPSPEAANLGKYGKYPISYNTGTPQIEIPLYNISVNDMNLPITVSYHASGIKVDEVASWVGSGWVLNAGGAITRVMRGRPDESGQGYWDKTQWNMWQNMQGQPTIDPNTSSVTTAKLDFQTQVANGQRDLQPDLFYFNFAGYSGRIVFDVDKNIVISPYQDLKIDCPFVTGNPQWVITTPEGIKYTFSNSDAEVTTPLSANGTNSPSFLSTWYLSEIRSLKQPGVISFYYNNIALGNTSTTPVQGVKLISRYNNPNQPCLRDGPYPTAMGSSEYGISAKYLDHIEFTGGSIGFGTSGRLDKYQAANYNGRKLDRITVFDGSYWGSNTQELKSFVFNYDYSTGRLTLLNIQELGKGGQGQKPTHKFEYNGGLPDQLDPRRDHWGYYNGKPNQNMIPALTPEENDFFVNTMAYADRSTDGIYSLSGMLTKIIYPTGGYTKFNFEPNTYYTSTTQTDVDSIMAVGATSNSWANQTTQSGTRTSPQPIVGYYESKLMDYYNSIQAAYIGGPINIVSTQITLTAAQVVRFSTRKISNNSGTVGNIAETYLVQDDCNFVSPICYDCNNSMTLQPGTYIMLAAASQPGVTVTFKRSLDYQLNQNTQVGGARIASIENNDGYKSNIKSYNYNYDADANGIIKSSGDLFITPLYKKGTPCGNLYVSAFDINPPTVYEGSHIGYKQVTETDQGIANGKIVRIYDNSEDDLTRSNIKSETYYNSQGNMVKQTSYSYNYESITPLFSRSASSIPMQIDGYAPQPLSPGLYYPLITVNSQSYQTYFSYPNQIVEKTFDQSHYPSFLSTTQTIIRGAEGDTYSTSHTLPTQIITSESSGGTTTENIVNSPDIGLSIDIKVPIRKTTLKNIGGSQYITSAVKNNYTGNLLTRVDAWESAVPLLYVDESTPAPQSFIPKLNYVYNPDKKLIQSYGQDGIKHSYVWDNNNINPIGEVVNSAGDVVAFTSFENSSNEGNWVFTLNQISDPNTKTGSNCYQFNGGLISTSGLSLSNSYKLSYWAKSGTPIISGTTGIVITSNDDPNPDANGWMYFEKIVTNTTTLSIGSGLGTKIDELRLYPANAQIRTFTYKPLIGISTANDTNHQIQYYEYDPLGRLTLVRDAKRSIVKKYNYHYKTTP